MLYYIFMIGIGTYNKKAFYAKCGIIVVGLITMVILFKDMVTPAFQEVLGMFPRQPERGLTPQTIVVFLGGSWVGYLLQRVTENKR